ncbi:hypothetical protein HLB23_13565 [Nocardia uniformis]|uniref:Uncharacterized protein n=1 Tax=Nocardia uniformis TaxID=53432 RepID=A0A849BZW5_9NOCA|nr:hypothetical protein [Nocardia uniformis]NNH70878.1 hypothetical protein [Nocardia uniformis]
MTPGFWLLLGSCCVVLLALRPDRGRAALRITRIIAVVGVTQASAAVLFMLRPAALLPADAKVAAGDGAFTIWPGVALVGACLVVVAAVMTPVDTRSADEADGLRPPIEV